MLIASRKWYYQQALKILLKAARTSEYSKLEYRANWPNIGWKDIKSRELVKKISKKCSLRSPIPTINNNFCHK